MEPISVDDMGVRVILAARPKKKKTILRLLKPIVPVQPKENLPKLQINCMTSNRRDRKDAELCELGYDSFRVFMEKTIRATTINRNGTAPLAYPCTPSFSSL